MNFHPNDRILPIEFVIEIDFHFHFLLVIEKNNEIFLDEIESINKMRPKIGIDKKMHNSRVNPHLPTQMTQTQMKYSSFDLLSKETLQIHLVTEESLW